MTAALDLAALGVEDRRATAAGGESGAARMAPGHRLVLAEHAAAHLDRARLVTSVEHHGRAKPGRGEREKCLYANRFACVPGEVAFVPPSPKRTSVQVTLEATVIEIDGHTPASRTTYPYVRQQVIERLRRLGFSQSVASSLVVVAH